MRATRIGLAGMAMGMAFTSACGRNEEAEPAAPFTCPAGASEGSCLAALAGACSGTLEDGGTWEISIDPQGIVSGTVTDAGGDSHEVIGLVDANGRILMSSSAEHFDGQIRVDGSVWGVWTDEEWLRGFTGNCADGHIEVDPEPPVGAGGTTNSGTEGACYLECNPPPEQPDAATIRQCVQRPSNTACLEQALSMCTAFGVDAFLYQPGCVCDPLSALPGDVEPPCGQPDWYRVPSYQCYYHCQGDSVSRCAGTTENGDCATEAAAACAATGTTVEQAQYVENCTCRLDDDTPACYPEWFRRQACYFKCNGESVVYCAVDLDAATCQTRVTERCAETGVEEQLHRGGCSCRDREGECAWPDWL